MLVAAVRKKKPTEQLGEWLDEQAALYNADALKPLPPTRTLGTKFGISHGTVFRVLCAMESAGKVWRHENGRFYPALAKRILGRPKPLAVMLRRMASWSSLGREVMEGFTDECGEHNRPILLFHNKDLLVQTTSHGLVRMASVARQRELLHDFILLHGETIGGVLFDEIWRDEALMAELPAELPAVNFYRPGGIRGAHANYHAGALLAISHLLASGCDRIFLLDPLPGYEPAQLFRAAARQVYQEISGKPFPADQEVALYDRTQSASLMRKLSSGQRRCGLICPEDNVSTHLVSQLRAKGIVLGRQHGLVSVMGTSVAEAANLTRVRYDYTQMGRVAAQMLFGNKPESVVLEPVLHVGSTTRS